MKRRTVSLLLLTPLLLLGVAWLAATALLGSTAGSRWLITRMVGGLEGELAFQQLDGSLLRGMKLEGLRYEDAGLVVTSQRSELAVDVDLLPLAVNVSNLRLERLSIHLAVPDDTKGRTLADVLGNLRLPIGVNVERSEVLGFAIVDSDGVEMVHWDRLAVTGQWRHALDDLNIELAADGLQLRIAGRLSLEPGLSHALQADGTADRLARALNLPPDTGFELALDGNGSATEVRLSSGPPAWRLSGVIRALFDDPVIDAEFSIEHWTIPGTSDPELRFMGVAGNVRGRPAGYTLEATGQLDDPGMGAVAVTLAGQGSLTQFVLDSVVAESDTLQVNGSGAIAWSQEVSIQLEATLNRFAPNRWLEDWPESHLLNGALAVEWRGQSIQIPELQFGISGTPFEARGNAVYDPDSGVIGGKLHWQHLAWPPGRPEPQVESERGSLSLSGTPEDWRLEGEMELATPGFPGGHFRVDGQGDRQSGALDIVHGEFMGGSLSGHAWLDWSGPFDWRSSLEVSGLDAGALWPEWPSRLDAALAIRHEGGTDRVKVDVERLDGILKGEAISGTGGLVFESPGIRFDRVRLRSGRSHVALHGHLAEAQGVAFELDVRRPGWLAQTLGGNIRGGGRYAPLASSPLHDLDLAGTELAWGDVGIESLTAVSAGSQDGEMALRLQVEGLWLGGTELAEAGEFALRGDRNRQQLQASLQHGDYTLRLGLDGVIGNWSAPLDGHWSGRLESLSLERSEERWLALRDPAPMSATGDSFGLQKACFEVGAGGGLCLDSVLDRASGIDMDVQLVQFPLSLIRRFLDQDVTFTQRIDGSLHWRQPPGMKPSGLASLKISPGRFGDPLDEETMVSTDEGYIGFELQDGNLAGGQFDIPFPGLGKIDLDFELTGVAFDGTGRIRGRAVVEFDDLSFIEAFTTGIDGVQGKLRSNMNISGVTADPVFNGSVGIENAGFAVPYLGMTVSEFEMLGHVNKSDHARLQGNFRMGEGEGTATIDADFRNLLRPRVEMGLAGSNLRVAELPDLEMDLDLDVTLGWRGETWQIGGQLQVPHAHITPITSFVTKVSESPDVTVVAGELPTAPNHSVTDELAFNGSLAVRVGNDVRVETDLADLGLSGAVDLDWNETLMPLANGALQVTGEVTAWGPLLHMTNSYLRFPSVPANNPVLDIRAERDVFGNTLIRSAGVRVSGTPRRPEVEAYTVPLTTRDRAWALLITGSDVNLGEGVGALDVGTYIAPRLFLSYGVSLFETQNVVGVRYDLKKGFGIKATSSQRESGLDVSYTFDH